MDGRVGSRHDAGVRRQRERDLRRGMSETHSSRSESVQVRSLGAAVAAICDRRPRWRAIAAQVIGARGVDGDEEGVGFARGSRLRLSALAAGREGEQAQTKAPAYTAMQLRLGSQQSLSRPPHTQVIVYTI